MLSRKPTKRKPTQRVVGLDLVQNSTNLDPTEDSSTSHIWQRALDLYISRLPEKDQESVLRASQEGNLNRDNLEQILGPLRSKYIKTNFNQVLKKINPTVEHILSFSTVVNVCLQSHPNPACLIWGSFALILEVSSRSTRLLDEICTTAESLSEYLPLFERWLRLFPEESHVELGDSLVKTLFEYISFLVETIIYLRKSSHGNFFRMLFVPSLKQKFTKAQMNIARLTDHLFKQVQTASWEDEQRRGEDLRQLLKDQASLTPLTSIKLSKPLYFLQNMTKNELFFGGSSILERMSILLHDESQRFQSVAIHGIGGCGKSQLALEYLHQHLTEYELVLWLHAESSLKLEDQLSQVGVELGLAKEQKDMGRCYQKFLRWLSISDCKWLIVFDNADDIAIVQPFFTSSSSGTIVVTSRDPLAREKGVVGKEIALKPFDKDEGTAFVLSFLGSYSPQDLLEMESIVQLVDSFAGLPLGLRVAAAIMTSKHYSPSNFLRMCSQGAEEVDQTKVPGTTKTIESLWDVSLRSITDDTKNLLEQLTLLDPETISFRLFEPLGADQCSPPGLENTRRFHDALGCLTSHSLVSVDHAEQNITIHRYLQEVMFRKLLTSRDRYESVFHSTLLLLRRGCPRGSFLSHRSPEAWKERRRFTSHAQFIQRRSVHGIQPQSLKVMAEILIDIAFYSYETGQYDKTISVKERIEVIIDSNAISIHPSILAFLYFWFGNTCNECNRAEEGTQSLKLAIETFEKSQAQYHDPEDKQILAAIYSSRGNSLTGLEQFIESETCHQKAIMLIVETENPSTKTLGRLYANLGSCLLWKGDLSHAESTLHTSLLKYDRKLGCTLYALGNVYLHQGRIEKGFHLHIETLEIFSRMFGESHPNTADSLYKVGSLYARADNPRRCLAKAENYLQKAKVTYERCWNEQNRDMKPLYARAQGKLGQVLLENSGGESKEGENLVQISADFLKSKHGSNFEFDPSNLEDEFNKLVYYWSR